MTVYGEQAYSSKHHHFVRARCHNAAFRRPSPSVNVMTQSPKAPLAFITLDYLRCQQ